MTDIALTAAEIEARAQEAIDILQYRPTIKRVKPPGNAAGIQAANANTSSKTLTDESSPALVHAINTLAMWHDVLTVQAHIKNLRTMYEGILANVSAPITSDLLSPSQQKAVTTYLNSGQITFEDYQRALLGRETPARQFIIKAWNSNALAFPNNVEALLYSDIVRIDQGFIPIIVNTAQALVYSTAVVLEGDTTGDLNSSLGSIALGTSTPYMVSSDAIASLVSTQQAVSAMASEIVDVTAAQQAVYAQQTNVCQDAQDLVSTLQQGLPTNNNSGTCKVGTGSLSELLAILQGIRVIFQLYNNGLVLNFNSLEAKLDQMINQIVMQVVALAASILAQLQATLLAPLTELILCIDTLTNNKAPASWTKFALQITNVVRSLVGKFNQNILDWYRHQWLYNNLATVKISITSTNQQQNNILTIIDGIISFLQSAGISTVQYENINNNTTGMGSVANTICQNVTVSPLATAPLPTLAIITPPAGTTLASLVQNQDKYGLQRTGTVADISANLLSDIKNLTA